MNEGSKGSRASGTEPSRLDRRLAALRTGSDAEAVLLLDASGAIVAAVGEKPQLDPIVFGSLACTHLAATADLASLIGCVEFRALVQQGAETTILLSRAADRVIASVHSGALAPARIAGQTEMGVAELEELMEAEGLGASADHPVDSGWRRDAAKRIDRIFRDGA